MIRCFFMKASLTLKQGVNHDVHLKLSFINIAIPSSIENKNECSGFRLMTNKPKMAYSRDAFTRD